MNFISRFRSLVAMLAIVAIAVYANYAHASTTCACDWFNTPITITGSGETLINTSTLNVNSVSSFNNGATITSNIGNALTVTGPTTSTGGWAVKGTVSSTDLSNGNYGLWGADTASTGAGGYGVYGSSTIGTGVYATGVQGVYVRSTTSYGINALSSTGSGAYIQGTGTTNSDGASIYGARYGVRADASSSSGIGIYATSQFIGGKFQSTVTSGTAYGIQAFCVSNNCTAVYASAPSGQTALFASGKVTVYGDVTINGNMTASGTKNFVIDHPLKSGVNLNHASIESSEVLNVYRGRITVPATGVETVRMPEWFNAINKNADIMVSCNGTTARWTEMSNGHFAVTAPAGSRCTWLVTAQRDDAYMRAHPFQLETPKDPRVATH